MLKISKKIYEHVFIRVYMLLSKLFTSFSFEINGVKRDTFTALGVPLLDIKTSAICQLGSNLVMVNSARYSMLGKNNRCKLVVSEGATLLIGDKVGMSNATIVATKCVKIGSNVMIGGGVTIVDSDFHSLNPLHWHTNMDLDNMVSLPVEIKDNVFIGMDSIILKGVTIGNNVVIAAGSVVSKSIPDNQIWGGNPSKFIRNNDVSS